MKITQQLIDGLVTIIKIGPKLNRDQREEIRTIVGELGDELQRALKMAIAYLEKAPRINEDQAYSDYLSNSTSKLLSAFNEFEICSGIYGLHDRFNQAFDPTRYSINLGSIQKVHDLIDSLGDGERMVIDGMDKLTEDLREMAWEFDAASDDDKEVIRRQINTFIKLSIGSIESDRKNIKRTVREVLKVM